jgi:hypothetical protein
MKETMDARSQKSNVVWPVLKRVFGLALCGGIVTALAGAVLHGLVNAILACRSGDWEVFTFYVGAGLNSGGIVSLLFGTVAFGVAGALVPHPKGSVVFRSLCRQSLFGMTIGSLLGLIGGASLGVMLGAAQSISNNAKVIRYFDPVIFFICAFYCALLFMLIGLVWGVARGARQAREL